MNNGYRKEMKKIGFLLAAGVVLILLFLVYAFKNGYMENARLGINDYLVLLAILLYPVGLAYGWRRMLDIALYRRHEERADRYYTVSERNVHHSGHLVTRAMVIGLVVCFGWILGVVEAIKTLRHLKREAV